MSQNRGPSARADGTEPPSPVEVTGSLVRLVGLTVEDPILADLLRRCPADEWPGVVERALAVGARGLLSMGVGVDLAEVDDRVRRSVEVVTAEAEGRVRRLLEEARSAMAAELDPEQRSSMVARAMAEFQTWRDQFLRVVDPDVASSHTGRMMASLAALLGPGGALEERLAAALDPTNGGSGFARLVEVVDRRLAELRDLLAEQRGRESEAERGTAKGFDFEDVVEERLRQAARHLGAVVERTSRQKGDLGGEALVGDYLVTLPGGARVVVEAKNVRSIGLTGSDGILIELDRAMANRGAEAAICISAQDAFPQEVGPFAVYGSRLLVVDDGEGTMVWVALRWAMAAASAAGQRGVEIDQTVVADRLQRIRQLGTTFTSAKRSLTDISGSVDKVRGTLESLRSELIGLVDELAAELGRGRSAELLVIRREAG